MELNKDGKMIIWNPKNLDTGLFGKRAEGGRRDTMLVSIEDKIWGDDGSEFHRMKFVKEHLWRWGWEL
mgnify:CR=1 FL=1